MPSVLKRTFTTLAILFLVAFAYAPLVDAEFVGEDFPVLIDAGRIAWPEMRPLEDGVRPSFEFADLFGVHGTDEHPVAAISLALSSWLWSDRGAWLGSEAVWLRAENLLLLCIAAFALCRLVRRLLLPWTGSEHARAAGKAAAAVFLVHPLSLSSVASVAARGDVLAMAIGMLSAAAFMRGRQERQYALTVAASVGAVVIGMCSAISMFLPLILAVGEFVSARRYRPASVRLRTASTTLIVFGGAITLEALLRYALPNTFEPPAYVRSLAAIASVPNAEQALSFTLEKLGVLFLPVNTFGISLAGFAIAGMITLVAVQPALVAARSAPRLWAWLVIAWLSSLILTELPQALVRVHSADLTHAQALFPAAAVMSVGLAVAATALSGLRRQFLPLVIVTGFAILAHANALPWKHASEEVASMRGDLEAARVLHGRDHLVLVLDPPTSVGGLDAVRSALPWMLDPAFNPGEPGSAPETLVRGLKFDAFRLLAREIEFTRLREQGVIVVFPAQLFGLGGDPKRLSVLLGPEGASSGPLLWREKGRSPVLNLEALSIRAVRVRALPATETGSVPAVSWRARSPLCDRSELEGVWIEGEDGPEAMFDVERSLCWLLGKQIRRVWFEEVLTSLVSAEVLREPQPIKREMAPSAKDEDWLFEFDLSLIPEPLAGEGRWVLELLDLATYEFFELEGRRSADGQILVEGATALVSEMVKRGGGPVVWSLDYVSEETTLARSRGRRIGRRGSPAFESKGR